MKVFLIILAVLAVLIFAICSLSATLTLVYDKGWHTKIKVLFIEKDIVLSEILSFILFPERKAEQVAEKQKNKKKKSKEDKPSEQDKAEDVPLREKSAESVQKDTLSDTKLQTEETPSADAEKKPENKKPKPNPIKNLWDKEGIVGILSLVSNVLNTANSAISTLIRGLHIYSLYVMILVGGGDADVIARSYGTLCKYYYPVKGMILSSMKVDNYDDYIQPDFIADRTETEFQLIAGINVGLLLKVVFKAAGVFLKNLIKDKKG